MSGIELDHKELDLEVEFEDLFVYDGKNGIELDQFISDYWGKRILQAVVSCVTFEAIREGFCNGNITEIVKECRKEDTNEYFSPEEMEEMESNLENGKITLILPFCYTSGAIALRSLFVNEMEEYGSDIEVGVYISKVGGAPAPWHYDNNHNITIQLYGSKDWHCIEGNTNTYKNRALMDPTRNYIEQQESLPSTDNNNKKIYHLDPGSIIYLPPGFWHSVVPVNEISISVDIRIGNIIHSKWICEAIFCSLVQKFKNFPCNLTSMDRKQEPHGFSVEFSKQMEFVTQNLPGILKSCRIPRPLPFENDFSNGITPGGSLDFLQGQLNNKINHIEIPKQITINNLISITLKFHGANIIVLQMLSISSLSNAEYFRYNLFCNSFLEPAIEKLIVNGSVSFDLLNQEIKTEDSFDTLETLIKILFYANIIHGELPDLGEQKNVKRQRVQ